MNGITRQKVIEVCKRLGLTVHERNYSLVETFGADEAFLTGTFGAQTPVSHIDGRAIGTEHPGPVTQKIRQAYYQMVKEAQ